MVEGAAGTVKRTTSRNPSKGVAEGVSRPPWGDEPAEVVIRVRSLNYFQEPSAVAPIADVREVEQVKDVDISAVIAVVTNTGIQPLPADARILNP